MTDETKSEKAYRRAMETNIAFREHIEASLPVLQTLEEVVPESATLNIDATGDMIIRMFAVQSIADVTPIRRAIRSQGFGGLRVLEDKGRNRLTFRYTRRSKGETYSHDILLEVSLGGEHQICKYVKVGERSVVVSDFELRCGGKKIEPGALAVDVTGQFEEEETT